MKKVGCLILATAALVLVAVLPAHAQKGRSGFGFRGGGSGGHQGSGFKGTAVGQQGFAFTRGHGHHHGHGGHHFHSGFFVGVGAPLWWWGWGWPYAYYPYYPHYPYYPYYYSDYSYYTYNPNDPYYPYYSVYPGQMTVQQTAPAYSQQGQPAEPYYWYYCDGAQAYYPYVQQCPQGWRKVVPTPPNGPKPD